ncbi:MAG TPA: flavin reductase family protein [Candidatus Eisenbacteria bacterium]|nr:flavin reductase family protein [Candidatus Eisenbacteria bacterium]
MTKTKLDFDDLDPKLRGKIVKASVIPRPIAWITSLNETGSINLAPFSYFNLISPSLLAVSFQKNALKEKDTFVNIMREKEAVIHIVDESLIKIMDESASPLGVNESEFDLTGLKLNPSLKIKTPGIKEALIAFEVVLENSIALNNYEASEEEGNLVIMRIVAAILDDKVYDKENNYILADQLKPIARLAGADYSALKILDYKRKY